MKGIEIDNLTIGYGERHLLEAVTTRMLPGRLVALIGRNGAGKSSLLRVLAGLDRPISGSVTIDGLDMSTAEASRRARAVSLVTTRRVRIPSMRCRDIVALGRAPYTDWIGRLSEADSRAVDRALELTGMTAYASRTMDSMSDGECQRVMIARAIAQDTPVMLLDEPTSFLDLPARYELARLLGGIAHDEGKTILFSTHELDIALGMSDDVAIFDPPHLHLLPSDSPDAPALVERVFGPLPVTFIHRNI